MPGSHHSTELERVWRYCSASALAVGLGLALVSLLPARSLADRGTPDSSVTSKQAAAPQAAPARPELVLDAAKRDFGEVFAGEVLDSPFNISNAGKAPLELMQRSLTSRASHSFGSGRFDSPSEHYRLVPVASRLAAPS